MRKEPMKTHFAPAERASQVQVLWEADRVTNSPIMDGILRLSGGLLAVLNAERQILATNTSLLQALGCRDAAEVLGLRVGEALQCVHARETEGGCGTTEFCPTCGAAIAKEVLRMSSRLAREISIQRALFAAGTSTYEPVLQTVTVARIVEDVRTMFARHGAAHEKTLMVAHTPSGRMLDTDPTLVLRVLGNMILNALEATVPGGTVRLSIEESPEQVTFSVWNDATIPAAIRNRIFQRNFSTKDDMGRGLGTYSMKLFGEQVLGGRVWFTSDASGTVFRFSLPAVSVG